MSPLFEGLFSSIMQKKLFNPFRGQLKNF